MALIIHFHVRLARCKLRGLTTKNIFQHIIEYKIDLDELEVFQRNRLECIPHSGKTNHFHTLRTFWGTVDCFAYERLFVT